MTVISFINQKGGVGKTTSAVEVAIRLAVSKKKVLCIDADPQGNMTYILGVNPDSEENGLKSVFDGQKSIQTSLIRVKEGVDLLSNNILMANADRSYTGINSMRILKKALSSVENLYDYCIIDSPPTLGIIIWNVLIASNYLIVPVNANALSIQGLRALSETINEVKEEANRSLRILGLLITRYNSRTKLGKEALPDLEYIASNFLKTCVFETKIRQSVAIEDSQANRKSTTSKKCPISKDYDDLCNEIVKKIEENERR